MSKLKFTVALAAGVSLVSMGSVMAADEVVVEPSHIWSGFYAGVGVGAGALIHDVGIDTDVIGPTIIADFNGIGGEGIFGELTAGYDYATGGGFVFGVGANARLSNMATTLELGGLNADITADYGFDVFARAGYLVTPQTMAYVLGGYSYQHFDIDLAGTDIFDWNSNGFVVGAGIETALTQRIHLKGEYRYSQYQTENFDIPADQLTVTPSFHTASLGITYRLGDPSPSSSLAGSAPVDFTGFYLGGAAGATGLSHNLALIPPLPVSLNGIGAEGISGRVMAGYDHEMSNGVVAGVQADVSFGTVSTDLSVTAPIAFGASIDQAYTWSITGRLGYKVGPRTMVYGLAGYTQEHYDINIDGGGTLADFTTTGFVVGGGVETAVTDNVFVGLEYRYAQTSDDLLVILELEPSSHTGLLSAKYKF